jgi:hypothetical protein
MKKLWQAFDLNEKEATTFLKLLELGAQPVSVLAKNLNIPRPTVYLVLEKLKSKSMTESFEKFGIKHVKAVNFASLFDLLSYKKLKITETEELLKKELPRLNKLKNKSSIIPKIKTFQGKIEVERVYRNIFLNNDIHEFCSFFNPLLVQKFMPKFHLQIPLYIQKNKILARELLIDCEEARNYLSKFSSKNHQIKIFSEEINFSSDTIICDDKTFMISYGKNENDIIATEIFNKEIAQTQQIMFNEMWKKF